MRIDLLPKRFEVSEGLRAYAQTRVWVGLRHWRHRIPWVAVRLTGLGDAAPKALRCRVDAWVRGAGPVSATVTCDDAYFGVGLAVSRVRREVERRVRTFGEPPRRAAAAAGAGADAGDGPPRRDAGGGAFVAPWTMLKPHDERDADGTADEAFLDFDPAPFRPDDIDAAMAGSA